MRLGLPLLWVAALAIALLAPRGPCWSADFKAPAHHRDIETVARDIAYRGGNVSGSFGMSADPELREELERRKLRFKEGIDDGNRTGMQAMVLEDETSGQTYVVFRGTWPNGREGTADAAADADPNGDTGSVQYNAHRERLARWAQKYPNSIVTGHSLGAALGQRFISEHPGAVREGVLFNAPAIATEHAERFARSPRQPPVTIYVGRTKVADDTSAPEYDIVSELGGQSHLPGRIVEVTRTDPHSGKANVLGTSHTATMLSGDAPRAMAEISYEDYQHRRETGWSDTLSTLRGAGDSVWLGIPAAAAAIWRATSFVKGQFGGGPVEPTAGMVQSAARDCTAAAGYVGRAQQAIQGSISALKISTAQSNLVFASDRSVGCPDVRARITSLEGAIGAARQAVRDRLQASLNVCSADALRETASQAQAFSGRAEFDAIGRQATDKLGRIAKAEAAFDAARTAYEAGNLDAARASLDAAKTGLVGFSGCADLDGRIVSGLSKIDQLEGVLTRARGAVEACEPGLLALIGDEYGTLTHPAMTTILRQAQAGTAAHAAFESAKARFSAGDLAGAKAELGRARRQLASVDANACAGIRDKISQAEAKIDKLEGAVAAAEQSVVSCDVAAMTRWRASLAKVVNPAARAVKAQLEKGEPACEARQRAQSAAGSAERCKAHFGAFAMADPKTAASARPQCRCVRGYQWNASKTACVKAPSTAERAAERDAWCKSQRGAGYRAGPMNAKGQYYCLPTQSTADAWCRQRNPGRGVHAGAIRADGTFACQQTRAGRLAEATQACRRTHGSMFLRVEARGRGFVCRYCGAGFQPRGGRCVARNVPRAPHVAPGTVRCPPGTMPNLTRTSCVRKPWPTPDRPVAVTPRPPPRGPGPAPRQPPARCVNGQFVNMTDPRCKPYW